MATSDATRNHIEFFESSPSLSPISGNLIHRVLPEVALCTLPHHRSRTTLLSR